MPKNQVFGQAEGGIVTGPVTMPPLKFFLIEEKKMANDN